MRVGIGYDVHRLVEGRDLVLGGIEFDFPLGLLGHSDADVLTHAIMDAILGALGEGDIGSLFPDTDPAYKDIYSIKLLEEVCLLMEQKGYKICNVDTVVICEKPKISPRREEIEARLASAMGTDPARVSVKASTSEGLGFTGQGQGIEARAIVLLEEI